MGLDLSLSGFVGAGGGLAYVLVAILWAVSRGEAAKRLLLAGLLGVHGALTMLLSLTTPEASSQASSADAAGVLLVAWGGVLTALFAGAFAWVVARETSRRATLYVGALLGLLAAAGAVALATGGIAPGKGDPALVSSRTRIAFALVIIGYAGMLVSTAALALRWKAGSGTSTAVVAVALALRPLQVLARIAPFSDAGAFFGAFGIACVLAWGPPWRRGSTRWGRNVLLGLLVWPLGWGALRLLPQTRSMGGTEAFFAPFGVVSALALALVLLKLDAWGVQPPEFARRRGPIAAVSLATLAIVAQIVENLLDARYGVLMGGVVAGALLFAATPLQRAMERATERRTLAASASADPPALRAPAASDSKREAYRRALRLAMRDRALTPSEEVDLAHVAHELGLSAPEAVALRHEVENEVKRG